MRAVKRHYWQRRRLGDVAVFRDSSAGPIAE